ncbi:MAG: hypothetical protein AAGI49_18710 [Bacteroidota bacterium]
MTLAWTLFSVYLLGTSYLGWLGFKRTKGFGSFAIGDGDLSPLVVGVTLAASTASAATFIINPGFVYVDGLAAFIHLAIGVYLGFVLMLVLLSFRFRRTGDEMKALTIPDWIGKRYNSNNFSLYFAFINLFTFAFIVLLVGGISIVMQKLLGVDNVTALLITLVFVTGYVLIGGTYAHVFTNMLQGSLMVGVTILVLATGAKLMFSGEVNLWQDLAAIDPNLTKAINPNSVFYNSFFSVFVAGFCIGAALVCQPHILTKALYVKTDKAVRNYILVFSLVFLLFCLLLAAGFWAHLVVDPAQLQDATTGAFRQDLVMTVYLQNSFPDWVFTIVSVVLLAAAMSTLDGLLVGISTITANDLVLNLVNRGKSKKTKEQKMQLAYRASHVILIVIAVLAFVVTLNPPKLLGIFGQTGVYALVVATVPPLLLGILFQRVAIKLVWVCSVLGVAAHFLLFFYGKTWFPNSTLAFANPGVTATLGLFVGLTPAFLGTLIFKSSAQTNTI